MPDFDPIELSRALARAEDDAWAWLDRLTELAVAEDAPLELYRPLLSKQHYDELNETLHKDDPLKPYLFRWMAHLIELRVNAASYTQCAHLRYHDEHPLDGPEKGLTTLDKLARRTLSEPRRQLWLGELARCSPKLSQSLVHQWQRRAEVFVRLGGPSLDETELPTPAAYDLADAALSMTQPLLPESRGLIGALAHSTKLSPLAFPARLNPPTIANWFRETRLLESVSPHPFTWPKPLAATSFALALDRFGAAWRKALAPRDQPFVVARDPQGLEERTTGWVFASLVASPSFQRRHLEGAPAKQRDVDRYWGLVGVHELRLRALRLLLRKALLGDHRERARAIEHLGERVWGQPLSSNLTGVLPQLRANDAQSLCAVGLAQLATEALVESHNDDWFRNPRAVEELRANAARPPERNISDPERVRIGLERYVASLTKALA